MTFSPFCALIQRRNTTRDDPPKQLFTGKERDEETGFDYFGARYYSSEIGRWLGVDPMEQDFTPFAYGGNNPVSNIDPDGLWYFDSNGNLVAEENDNYETLVEDIGNTVIEYSFGTERFSHFME